MGKTQQRHEAHQAHAQTKFQPWEHLVTLVAKAAFQVSRKDGCAEYCALMAEVRGGRISYTPGVVRIRTQLPVTTTNVRSYTDPEPLVRLGAEFVPSRHFAAGNQANQLLQLFHEMSLLEPGLVSQVAKKRAV